MGIQLEPAIQLGPARPVGSATAGCVPVGLTAVGLTAVGSVAVGARVPVGLVGFVAVGLVAVGVVAGDVDDHGGPGRDGALQAADGLGHQPGQALGGDVEFDDPARRPGERQIERAAAGDPVEQQPPLAVGDRVTPLGAALAGDDLAGMPAGTGPSPATSPGCWSWPSSVDNATPTSTPTR
jgi:hypothetical protein